MWVPVLQPVDPKPELHLELELHLVLMIEANRSGVLLEVTAPEFMLTSRAAG